MESVICRQIIEAALLCAKEPMNLDRLHELFSEEAEKPSQSDLKNALQGLEAICLERPYELKEVASGFCLRIKQSFSPWLAKIDAERPSRYSRTFLETLALIVYRQPITRAEIEEVRGVAVNSVVIKSLQERGWIRVVGHRDVPGKPSLFATTKAFLDYFNLKSLDALPPLDSLADLEAAEAELTLQLQHALPLEHTLEVEMVDA